MAKSSHVQVLLWYSKHGSTRFRSFQSTLLFSPCTITEQNNSWSGFNPWQQTPTRVQHSPCSWHKGEPEGFLCRWTSCSLQLSLSFCQCHRWDARQKTSIVLAFLAQVTCYCIFQSSYVRNCAQCFKGEKNEKTQKIHYYAQCKADQQTGLCNVNRLQLSKRGNDVKHVTSGGLRNDLRTPDVRFIPCVTPLLGPSPPIESSDCCLGLTTPALWEWRKGFEKLFIVHTPGWPCIPNISTQRQWVELLTARSELSAPPWAQALESQYSQGAEELKLALTG